jgi:hypothetical protein
MVTPLRYSSDLICILILNVLVLLALDDGMAIRAGEILLWTLWALLHIDAGTDRYGEQNDSSLQRELLTSGRQELDV